MSTKSIFEEGDNLVQSLWQLVICHSHSRSSSDDVARALLCFMVRVSNTWRSIRTLRNNTSDAEGFMIDAGTLLRAMYDAYFQAEYLVSDPSKSEERAADYFDFEHVEKYKSVERLMSHNNWVAQRLQSSSKRAEGEKENLRHFERVKKRFSTTKSPNKTRSHWYPGNLLELANIVKKADEYDTFLAIFNGCVHTSGFASKNGPPVSSQYVLEMASMITAKIARLNVAHNRIELTKDHQELLDVLCRSPNEESHT